MLTEARQKQIHNESNYNKEKLADVQLCGCFYCLEIYSQKEISEWIDNNEQTALCAKCGIDSVIPSNVDKNFGVELLKELHEYWFGKKIYAQDL